MRIFAEITTPSHFIFVVRPPILFDLKTIEGQVHPEAKEGIFMAFHVLNKRLELFALARSRKLKAFAKAAILDAPQLPSLAEDEEQARTFSNYLQPDDDELEQQLLQTA